MDDEVDDEVDEEVKWLDNKSAGGKGFERSV